jgi:hypothetical protein
MNHSFLPVPYCPSLCIPTSIIAWISQGLFVVLLIGWRRLFSSNHGTTVTKSPEKSVRYVVVSSHTTDNFFVSHYALRTCANKIRFITSCNSQSFQDSIEVLVRDVIPLGSWRWVTTDRQKNGVTERGSRRSHRAAFLITSRWNG